MARDPYQVLGVSPGDSDEKIKQVYRDLARKYHPDAQRDDATRHLAEEKMKEINEAYDAIMDERKGKTRPGAGYGGAGAGYGGGFGGAYGQNRGYQGSYQTYSGENAELYARVRALISQGNIAAAESLLNQIEDANRNAEWYFLMGSVCYSKGWYDEAREDFTRAAQMNPNNAEYVNAVNRMSYQNTAYRTVNTSGRGCSSCDMCSSLLCADCCCECFGGDLIPCC